MTATITLTITGMTCDHCVKKVSDALRGVRNVEEAEVNLQTGRAVVRGDNVVAEDLVRAVKDVGFGASLGATDDCCGVARRVAIPAIRR